MVIFRLSVYPVFGFLHGIPFASAFFVVLFSTLFMPAAMVIEIFVLGEGVLRAKSHNRRNAQLLHIGVLVACVIWSAGLVLGKFLSE